MGLRQSIQAEVHARQILCGLRTVSTSGGRHSALLGVALAYRPEQCRGLRGSCTNLTRVPSCAKYPARDPARLAASRQDLCRDVVVQISSCRDAALKTEILTVVVRN